MFFEALGLLLPLLIMKILILIYTFFYYLYTLWYAEGVINFLLFLCFLAFKLAGLFKTMGYDRVFDFTIILLRIGLVCVFLLW